MDKITNVVLVTGGMGYIGSHVVKRLLKKKLFNVLVIDNFVNSHRSMFEKLKQHDYHNQLHFIEFDLVSENDQNWIDMFQNFEINVVIHLAGLKSIEESIKDPLSYLENNLMSTLRLIKFMKMFQVDKIVFSSSATVYGNPQFVPVVETDLTKPTNPYGETKQINEDILKMNKHFLNSIILRYFNPIGCDKDLGEPFDEKQKNIVPVLLRDCLQNQKCFEIFGNDWKTSDGTAVRDYIHIKDLASAHIKSIKYLLNHDKVFEILNIGTGKGTSVLELLTTFNQHLSKFNTKQIEWKIAQRRNGDVESVWADCSKSKQFLKWKSKLSVRDAIRDSLEFYFNTSTRS